jgi:hypothetical protein
MRRSLMRDVHKDDTTFSTRELIGKRIWLIFLTLLFLAPLIN